MTPIVLRDVREEDLPVLFAQQLDPAATRMAAFPPRQLEAFTQHWLGILADERSAKKTIEVDGRVAGYLVRFEQSGEQEVGYWIGREYWGRGIATRALAEFLSLAGERPLYAHVARHNVASIRVLQKCGFTVLREGTGTTRGEEVEEVVFVLAAGQGPATQ